MNAYVNQLDVKNNSHIFMMAIQFYLMNDPQVQDNIFKDLMFCQPFDFGDHQRQSESIMDHCPTDVHYIMFCIDKALQNLHSFKGNCFRRLNMANEQERAYYTPGKIFRFQNVTSATMQKHTNEHYKQGTYNVEFHIFSVQGKPVVDCCVPGSDMEKEQYDTILFRACSEFLVCRREEKDGVLHIYIRQIETGLQASRLIFWLDDRLISKTYKFRDSMIQMQSHFVLMNPRYIFKAQSLLARSYFDSEFFKNATKRKKVIFI